MLEPITLPVPPDVMVRACDVELAKRGDLASYLRCVWPGYRTPRHVSELCRVLQAVDDGKITRLIVAMPPRHGKSMAVSGWIARRLQARRQEYVIHASYGQEYIEGWGRKIRRIIEGPGLEIFPAATISRDSRSASRLDLVTGSEYYAVGRGGPVTGRGAHALVLDDLLKDRAEADSDAIRRQIKEWYSEVAYTRLMPGGVVVVIATRWHEDDLSGWLLRDHAREGWTVVDWPAIAGRDDPLGRPEGEALWPEDYPVSRLLEIKAQLTNEMGSRAWSALYQQSPIPASGSVFRTEWVRRYQPPLLPGGASDFCVTSWDTASKDKEVNDWSVGQVWRRSADGYALEDQIRAHYDYPTMRRVVIAQAQREKPDVILIEDKGLGTALIADVRSLTRFTVHAVDPGRRSKLVRAQAVSPVYEAGRVWLPEGAGWVPQYLDEMASFPHGANDDQIDASSQAIEYLQQIAPAAKRSAEDDRILSSTPAAGSM